MVKEWIEYIERSSHGFSNKMKVFDLKSKNTNKITIKKNIAKNILIGLRDPSFLKQKCKNKTEKEAILFIQEYVNNAIIPCDKYFSPKKSFWGEIICSEILKEFRNHILPVYRLRHKEKQSQAMRGGSDIVTCFFNEQDKLFISFSEVKTKGNIRSEKFDKYKEAIENAYNSIQINNCDSPEILDHMSTLLYYDDKYNLFDKFSNAFDNSVKYTREFNIFMVMEKKRWEEEILEYFKNGPIELPNLIINILLIENLDELINEVYDLIPQIAMEVINDK